VVYFLSSKAKTMKKFLFILLALAIVGPQKVEAQLFKKSKRPGVINGNRPQSNKIFVNSATRWNFEKQRFSASRGKWVKLDNRFDPKVWEKPKYGHLTKAGKAHKKAEKKRKEKAPAETNPAGENKRTKTKDTKRTPATPADASGDSVKKL